MTKSILITGVAGFIGRYVARLFFQEGWEVIGIDNSPPENAPLANLSSYHSLRLPNLALNNIFDQKRPKVCIHCAGRASVGLSLSDPMADFYTNTVLTFEILNSLRLYSPECRFIFLSSAAVYGNPQSLPVKETQPPTPLSPYGFHKLQCEQLCQEFTQIYGIPTASLRIFSAYGSGLRRQVVWDICSKAITQHKVTLQGTGQESRDFIHVIDIAQALMIVANFAPMTGEVYNLASGEQVAIASLAQLILDNLDYQGKLEFDGIIPTGNPINWQADLTKLNNLGFEISIPLERGIQNFVTWCRAELGNIK